MDDESHRLLPPETCPPGLGGSVRPEPDDAGSRLEPDEASPDAGSRRPSARLGDFIRLFARLESQARPRRAGDRRPARRPDVGPVLSYRLLRHGPLMPVLGRLRSRGQKHESLSLGLVPLRAMDGLRAAQHPGVASNGIHVFVDMSNINISFLQTLRLRYSVDGRARFAPLPPLDLQFLTEVLVRGRRVVALNAGCSVLPAKPEPRYIRELRRLGYHVDVRERKRVTGAARSLCPRPAAGSLSWPSSSSSADETPAAATGTVRYVEDFVDETLQMRIAESVMEYFERQGTLVLATGDAQPAQHSDGFLAYAQRALKMGWNVEVVSWKSSLSSCWTSSAWMARWADRFRVIELDDFVDDLLACHV